MKTNIIITGGSSGIGLELVKHFLKKKFIIYTSYNKSEKNLYQLKKKFKDSLYYQRLNLQNPKNVKDFIFKLKKLPVTFDILILNALFNNKRKEFKKISLVKFNKIFMSNFLSNVFLIKSFIKNSKRKKFKIIHISSLVSKKGSWGLSFYGPIKAAIDNLFKCLNYEYKGYAKFVSIYLEAVNTSGYRFTNTNKKNKNIISVKKAGLKILKKL